jgi:hypothetical protein
MTTKEIIEYLKEKETNFLKTKSFSQLPGIYAFFFIGNDFPLLGDSVSKHQIIYIGKTESSQEKRDAKTHFTTGKTGSSTVRKSIGSLLCSQENLKPIPRNNSDYAKGRFSHFKFDNESEIKITNWMENNLALSFYEYPKTKQEIEDLETEIINELIPILNILKNPKNTFRETLQQLRKNCAAIARKNSNYKDQKEEIKTSTIFKKNKKMTTNIGTIFIDNITNGDSKSRNIRITVNNKHLFPTEQLGNPMTYNLNFSVNNKNFIAKYKIGSKDGKSRSGVLKLGDEVYNEILKIKAGTNLKISKLSENKYIIERL